MAAVLALTVFGLYWQTHTFEFITVDDPDYVFDNQHVLSGLKPSGMIWAFGNRWSANWQPVTWLSLMADVSLFGADAGAMHLVNAAFHALASGLLFLLLVQVLVTDSDEGERKTMLLYRDSFSLYAAAFLAAAFWAVHPLRAESVAWISSRKDVLSAVFCFLGLMAWLADVRTTYGRRSRYTGWAVFSVPPLGEGAPHEAELFKASSWSQCGMTRYGWAAMMCFVFGYMAKPTMMVFPAFALLLEWYKTGCVRWRPLVVFALLASAFLLVTVYAQEEAMSAIPVGKRIGNAAESIVVYIRQMAWPVRLSVFHPYLPMVWWRVILGGMTIIGMVIVVVCCFTRVPVVSCMVAWFGVALLPVIGLVSVGSASHADRYTYLPAVGVTVGLAVGLKRLLDRVSNRRDIRDAIVSVLVLICLAYATAAWRYIGVWRDTLLLSEHAVKSEPRNAWMWQWVGDEYLKRFSNPDKAIDSYRKSLALNANPEILGLLSVTLAIRGAEGDIEEVKRLCTGFIGHEEKDTFGASLAALAIVAMREMRWQDAIRFFEESFKRKTKPKDVVRVWYAMCLYNVRRFNEAAQVFTEVAENASDPDIRRDAKQRMEMARQQIRKE